jgi:hypothetical protein
MVDALRVRVGQWSLVECSLALVHVFAVDPLVEKTAPLDSPAPPFSIFRRIGLRNPCQQPLLEFTTRKVFQKSIVRNELPFEFLLDATAQRQDCT